MKLGACQLVASASSSATPGARFCQSNTNEFASDTSFCITDDQRQYLAVPGLSSSLEAPACRSGEGNEVFVIALSMTTCQLQQGRVLTSR